MSANEQNILLELLLAGFFAVACIRASVRSSPADRLRFGDLLRLPGRVERLQRSRWQWFSMVALMLVLRLQGELPLVLEVLAGLQFIVFLVLPNRCRTPITTDGRGNAATVGSR